MEEYGGDQGWYKVGVSWRYSSHEFINDAFPHSGQTIVSFVPAGNTGARGVSGADGAAFSGAEGDFGGDSFSFYFNSGYLDAKGAGSSGVKLLSFLGGDTSEVELITGVTGINISVYNYKGGETSGWLYDFGNYGTSANRGMIKMFRRESTNENFVAFTITGTPVLHEHDDPDFIPSAPQNWYNMGITGIFSSHVLIQDDVNHELGPVGVFIHSGETVVSFVPNAGGGGGGGGGGGSPATGYTGAFQYHAGGIIPSGESLAHAQGVLSGSTVLFEGFDSDNAIPPGHLPAGKIGIGREFQDIDMGYRGEAVPPEPELCGMSGILDVRGDIYISGNFLPHESGGKWWNMLWANTGRFNGAQFNTVDVTGPGARVHVHTYESNEYLGNMGDGEIVCPTGYFDTIDSWLNKVGEPPVAVTDYGLYLGDGCLHFAPKSHLGADLGHQDLYWNSLYVANQSIIMSGAGMTGAVHIGFDNDHNLRISQPKTGTEVTTSGTFVTGYSPSTVAEIKFSGEAGGSTTLKAVERGKLVIFDGMGRDGQTVLTNTGIESNSGLFQSGLTLKSSIGTYFDVHDNGADGEMTFCGQLNQCVEDLGEFTYTGWNPDLKNLTTGNGGKFILPMSGSNLKTMRLSAHAHGLHLTGIQAGQSITVFITATGDPTDPSYYRFLSGNNVDFVGIEPHTIKAGRKGLLTVTAYGTGEENCIAHWAETDYIASI
jgi:hypothetical protein